MHGKYLLSLLVGVLYICFCTGAHEKQLLVLVPPSKYDPYYAKLDLTDFYVNYANAIKGKDDVVLIIEQESVQKYKDRGIPDSMILVAQIDDPWIRDFSYVRPQNPTSFKFIGGGTLKEAEHNQNTFRVFANNLGLTMKHVDAYVDGGNVVENGYDMAIVTTKFLDDNPKVPDAYKLLSDELGVSRVAIITADEPVLGHADGMVAITGDHTVLVTSYEEPFRSQILAELETDLGDVDLVEIPTFNDDSKFQGGYASSCGVYINSVVTHNYIYVPQFGNAYYDQAAKQVIEQNAHGRTVVPVDARDVCKMGGSLRCLSWQVEGPNAELILAAARGLKK